jgi:acetylornithine deacetylase/succinyl-diaminopimelate desuccinylase-like protein
VKLDALSKLWAMRRLKDVPQRRPFYFLGTYGEEAGLRGARTFMATAPFRPFAVLCGEPSELRICHAHKGYAVARVRFRTKKPTSFAAAPSVAVTFEGRAAHSSTPHLGVNAIDRALDALSVPGSPYAMFLSGGASANTIPARCDAVIYSRHGCGPSLPWAFETPGVEKPVESEWANVTTMIPLILKTRALWRERVAALRPTEDARFSPSGAVANVTRIRTWQDEVELTLDARLLPEHDAETFVTAFQREAEALATDDVEIRMEIDRRANGMSASPNSSLVRTFGEVLTSMGLNGAPVATPTSTEAGVFARAGIDAVVFGPSLSTGNAHTANEHARLGEVERAIDVYEQLIRKLCG